ncbi:hypothetical protein Hanom_Chr14g01255651 [Helianthus anomalus]
MRTRRRFRCRRISKILKSFDPADGLLLLSDLSTETVARDGGVHGAVLHESSRNLALSHSVDDNNEGVTRLSAYAVTQAFPADWRGRCSIVYQRCRRGSCSAPPVEIPTGVHMVAPATSDGEGINPWIVDPHPLAWYGEVLHTLLGVLDMFPDV